MASPTAIAAYLVLFLAIGAAFLFVHLLLGRFVRPDDPHAEKKEIYECGEPAIGSSFVQFDLRFYVVALVFIVFDAEVAFLFPAATVFGKQTQLSDARLPLVAAEVAEGSAAPPVAAQSGTLSVAATGLFRELGMSENLPSGEALQSEATQLRETIDQFTLYVYLATILFFVVLFVGFAYEWKTGAFDWVRAVTGPRGDPRS